LRKINEPKRDEILIDWRKLHNELHHMDDRTYDLVGTPEVKRLLLPSSFLNV
jgi:hypothetical protein